MVPETSKTIQRGSFLRHPSRSDPGPSSGRMYTVHCHVENKTNLLHFNQSMPIYLNPIQLNKVSTSYFGGIYFQFNRSSQKELKSHPYD